MYEEGAEPYIFSAILFGFLAGVITFQRPNMPGEVWAGASCISGFGEPVCINTSRRFDGDLRWVLAVPVGNVN
jgi:hypothetical protein